MVRGIRWFIFALLPFVLLACATKTVQIAPEEKKAPVTVAAPEIKAGWQAEWEKIVQEAKKEGKAVVYGPPNAETRKAFTEAFQRAYPGILLEYTGMMGAQTSPKIKAERKAGLYIVDVHIGGTTTILTQLREFSIPIKPLLILPEVKDPRVWLEGRLDFADDAEEINLVFTILADSRVAYNSELVNPSEITSWWDQINPKWRGKIIMWDPRAAGSGLATATFWYLNPKLGMDFIKAFADNKPILTRDLRFLVESVARGKYSIINSPDTAAVFEFQKAGMPLRYAEIMKEGTYSTAAFGSVVVLDKAPHPNAAVVFLNWLLGKEGQTLWSTTGGFASRRLDVPVEHLPEAVRPKAGVTYQPNYKEAIVMKKDEVAGQLNKIFAGF